MIYRILQRTFYDQLGKIESDYYMIQVRRSFLGIKFWRNITECVCNYGDCYNSTVRFRTFNETEDYIYNVLCKKIKPRSVKRVVAEVPCIR